MSMILRTFAAPRLFVSAILIMAPALLLAQNPTLRIESTELVPGEEFELFVQADLDRPIRGFQAGIQYPSHIFTFLGADLLGTVLAAQPPEVVSVATEAGIVTFVVEYTGGQPTDNPIPKGNSLDLLRLRFRIGEGLEPGDSYAIDLKTGLGHPPISALIYEGTWIYPPETLTDGLVKVTDKNVLLMNDVPGAKRGDVVEVEIAAFNVIPIQGFSLGIKFDPTLLRVVDLDMTGTITESVGAESVDRIIDNVNGEFILGVLLDVKPPYDNQMIPAAGMALTIAKIKVQVIGVPAGGVIDLEFRDGLGSPPTPNVFVINNHESVSPLLMGGKIEIQTTGIFLRGDANSDGMVDLSDAIATLTWVLQIGLDLPCVKAADSNDDGAVDIRDAIFTLTTIFLDSSLKIPPPNPTPGPDPTEDDLPCPP